MKCLPLLPILLADAERFRHLGRKFRAADASAGAGNLLAILLAAALLTAALWLFWHWYEQRSRRGYRNSGALFRELCRAHGIDWRDRQLLWRLARAKGLDEPNRLFVEPELLAADALPPRWADQAEHLAQLRDRLFGLMLGGRDERGV